MCRDADCKTGNKERGEGGQEIVVEGWRGGGVDGVMICRKVRENSNFGPNFSPPLEHLGDLGQPITTQEITLAI
jgi:hypothetical protein